MNSCISHLTLCNNYDVDMRGVGLATKDGAPVLVSILGRPTRDLGLKHYLAVG